ncbi:hypothetical protein [Actinoplanes subglobosus]|uniref:Uncharacterized protein n=1 Tax=Actinoplanes subglobosus TaxID=1547892 RepID=A0ABV8IRF8_9ACTN
MPHVLTRLNGFGMTLLPHWPYAFEREPGAAAKTGAPQEPDAGEHGSAGEPGGTGEPGGAVRVTRWTEAGAAHTVINTGEPADGPYKSDPDVVDVGEGRAAPFWLIETSVFRTRWPVGFTVESPHDATDGTAFYLNGPGQATIFPQGPVPQARLADPDALIAPDQTVLAVRALDDGITVIELTYDHDGEPWWQSHWTIPYPGDRYLVITAQSLLGAADQTRTSTEYVVTSLETTG